jgi:glycosyltransferase involved in cell wall biosynthesis
MAGVEATSTRGWNGHIGVSVAGGAGWGGVTQYAAMLLAALGQPCTSLQKARFSFLGEPPDLGMTEAAFGLEHWGTVPLSRAGPGSIARRLPAGRLRSALRRAYRSMHPAVSRAPDPDASHDNPELSRRFRDLGLDLLVFSMPNSLAVEVDLPCVMAIHDVQHRLQPHFPEYDGAYWAATEYVCRNAARRGTWIVADSETGRADLLECYQSYGLAAERVLVLPFTRPPGLRPEATVVEAERVRRRYRLPERFVFYPAQFWPHKNHARLVEALGLLKRRMGRRVDLVLTGSTASDLHADTYARVLTCAGRLEVLDQVHYLGYVDDADVTGLYGAAAALVMPTFFGPTNIPIIEAWSVGCPVATSDVRGSREFCGDAALLVQPGSSESIAEGILRVWDDDHQASRLVAAGRRRVADVSPDRFRERLCDILATVSRTGTAQCPV